ncbi:MAG: hypothetical protein ACJ77K_07295 [Bacteroidia bacterium]
MMKYLTYNDQPSGVYFSQVTDVCNFVRKELNVDLGLIAFISLRGFSSNRKKIKKHFPQALVLPMFPKSKNWRMNRLLLSLLFTFKGPESLWCRGIFAANLALDLKAKRKVQKVVFDGRGAYKAEFSEYLHKITGLNEDFDALEKRAVRESDYRLAVSGKLVDYWRREFGYGSDEHVIIPCTLSAAENNTAPGEKEIVKKRVRTELGENKTVFVYSGSSADWQSIHLIDDVMFPVMRDNPHSVLLVLSTMDLSGLKVTTGFPDRVHKKWLKPEDVMPVLSACDYGLMIRERSVTNEVASPTKFAEYLSAGLDVLISEGIGDFTTFVAVNNCGTVIGEPNKKYTFNQVSESRKNKNRELSRVFEKTNYLAEFKKIISVLSHEQESK